MIENQPGTPSFEVREYSSRETDYCFVVVVWNEGERIREQLRRMERRAALADIIIADGASDDGSLDEQLLRGCRVRAHLITRERGLSTALRMAFSFALDDGYGGVVTVDGNGKDGVESLPLFLDRLEHGYDLIQGSHFLPGGGHRATPFERMLGIRCIVRPAGIVEIRQRRQRDRDPGSCRARARGSEDLRQRNWQRRSTDSIRERGCMGVCRGAGPGRQTSQDGVGRDRRHLHAHV